jgi:hypothetical protein
MIRKMSEPGRPGWPAVGDEQRQRVLVLRADVQEVDAEAVDAGLVLAPIVQYRLAAAPVVAVTPVIDQRLDFGERGARSSRRLSPRPASGSGRCGG